MAGIEVVTDEASGHVHLVLPSVTTRSVAGSALWREGLRYHDLSGCSKTAEVSTTRLVPLFDAGNHDTDCYRDGYWTNANDPAKRSRIRNGCLTSADLPAKRAKQPELSRQDTDQATGHNPELLDRAVV